MITRLGQRWSKPFLVALAYLSAFLILDQTTQWVEVSGRASPWFPPAGLSLVLLLAFGIPYTPLLWLSLFLSALWIWQLPVSLPALLLLTTLKTAGYSLIAVLLRHILRINLTLRLLRDLLWFVVVVLAVTYPLSFLMTVSAIATGWATTASFDSFMRGQWGGDAIGIFTLVPFFYVYIPWIAPRLTALLRERSWRLPTAFLTTFLLSRGMVQLLTIIAIVVMVFAFPPGGQFYLIYLCFIPLFWIAITSGLPGVTGAILVINLTVTLAIRASGTDMTNNLIVLRVFMLGLALIGLLLGWMISDRRQIEETLRQARDRSEQEVQARTAELLRTNALLQAELAERKRAEEVIRHQNEYLAALHETTLGLIHRLDLHDLLEAIVTHASRLVGTPDGYIYLLEPDESRMTMQVGTGLFSQYIGYQIKPGDGLAGRIWQSGSPLALEDYHTWPNRLPDFVQVPFHAIVGVPLKSGAQVVGVLGLTHSQAERQFQAREVELLNRFAELASIALDNARLYALAQRELGERQRAEQELERHLRETLLLNRVIAAATSALNPEAILTIVCEELAYAFSLPQVAFARLDAEHQQLVVTAEYCAPGRPSALGAVIPIAGNQATQYVLERRVPLAITNAQADPRQAVIHDLEKQRGTVSLLIVPVIANDQVIGTIGMDSLEPREFTYTEMALAENVARAVSQALQNAQLYAAAQRELAERKRAEAALMELNETLEQRVNERTTQLEDLMVSLQREIAERKEAEEWIRREAARTQSLVHSAARLNAQLDLEAVLNAVCAETARALNIQAVSIFFYDQLTEELRLTAGIGLSPERKQGLLPMPRTFYDEAVQQMGNVIVLPDLQAISGPAGIAAYIQAGIHTLVLAGMEREDQLIGTLTLMTFDAPRHFSDDELALLQGMADQAALAITNARLFEERQQAESQLRRYAQRLMALSNIGQRVLASLDVDVVLRQIIDELLPLLPGTLGASILLQEGQDLVFAAVGGESAEALQGQRIPANVGVAGHVLQTGEAIRINREKGRELLYRPIEAVTRRHTQSLLAVPIKVGGKNIGVIEAVDTRSDIFSEDDLRLLDSVAGWAAIAISNARQHAEIRRRLQESEALLAISQAVSETLEPGKIFRLIVDAAQRIIPHVEQAVIHRFDEATGRLQPVATAGALNNAALASPPLIEQIVNQAIAQGGVINVGDTTSDPHHPPPDDTVQQQSLLVAPIQSGTQRFGALSVLSATPCAFSKDDERLLTTLALEAAIAAANASLYQQEREQRELAEALRDTAATVTSTLDLDEVLEQILTNVDRVVPHDAANIMLLDTDQQFAQVVRSRGYGDHRPGGPILTNRLPVTGVVTLRQIMTTGQPVVVPDTGVFPGWIHSPETGWLRSHIAVPIRSKGKIVGFLNLDSATPGFFTPAHAERLQAFANQSAIAIENARLYDHLKTVLRQREETQAQLIQAEKFAATGRLAAAIAHEINNPLQAVQGCLSLAQEQTPAGDNAIQEYLNVAQEEINRVAHIVQEMHDFYRPSKGKMLLTDVNPLIKAILTLSSKKLTQSQIALKTSLLPDLPPVMAVADQLKQVFMNIVLNALDAMPGGGVLQIMTRRGKSRQGDTTIEIVFQDTGVGITPEMLPHIFDPFYTTKSQGTGLGLFTSYNIIQYHGGDIQVDSTPGQGTTFTIQLPVAGNAPLHTASPVIPDHR